MSVNDRTVALTSSKKMMHAFFDRAIWNSSRTMRAPSPMYFCTSSLPAAPPTPNNPGVSDAAANNHTAQQASAPQAEPLIRDTTLNAESNAVAHRDGRADRGEAQEGGRQLGRVQRRRDTLSQRRVRCSHTSGDSDWRAVHERYAVRHAPMTRMKHASVRLATARAERVLPVPGGPYSSTP